MARRTKTTAIQVHDIPEAKLSTALREVGEDDYDNQYSDVAQYGRPQFWDDRYSKTSEPFEWYYGYEYFKDAIRDNIARDARVMIAGCGNSNMLEDMALDGYTNLVGADISRVVIAQLSIRLAKYPQISFFQGQITDTNLKEESFDAIIDKALFDSLLCTQTGPVTVAQYMYEVERLLKETGVFFLISHGTPEDNLPLLEQYDIDEPYFTPWGIEVQGIVKPKQFADEHLDPDDPESLYFIYIATKSEQLVKKKKIKENKIQAAKTKKSKARKQKAPPL